MLIIYYILCVLLLFIIVIIYYMYYIYYRAYITHMSYTLQHIYIVYAHCTTIFALAGIYCHYGDSAI